MLSSCIPRPLLGSFQSDSPALSSMHASGGDSVLACLQIQPVGTTGTYTVAIVNGRGAAATCPDYLGGPVCTGAAAPLLQTFTTGTTGYQQWTFTAATSTC